MRHLIILLLFIGCSEPFEYETITVEHPNQHYPSNLKDGENEFICFYNPETQPQYPGGMSALYKYIQKNLEWPNAQPCVEGKVFVTFVVREDGSTDDLEITKGVGDEYDKAALEVFENMPNWIPGKINDQPKKMKMVIPVTFTFR